MLGLLAVCLAFLRAVDTAEADTFRVPVVQDFESVAVEDANDWAGEVGTQCDGKPTEKKLTGNKETALQQEKSTQIKS